MTATRVVTAQVTEDGPLQGADVRIWWDADEATVAVDVHLDAIGRHPARWVPIQLVDQYLDTPDLGGAA